MQDYLRGAVLTPSASTSVAATLGLALRSSSAILFASVMSARASTAATTLGS